MVARQYVDEAESGPGRCAPFGPCRAGPSGGAVGLELDNRGPRAPGLRRCTARRATESASAVCRGHWVHDRSGASTSAASRYSGTRQTSRDFCRLSEPLGCRPRPLALRAGLVDAAVDATLSTILSPSLRSFDQFSWLTQLACDLGLRRGYTVVLVERRATAAPVYQDGRLIRAHVAPLVPSSTLTVAQATTVSIVLSPSCTLLPLLSLMAYPANLFKALRREFPYSPVWVSNQTAFDQFLFHRVCTMFVDILSVSRPFGIVRVRQSILQPQPNAFNHTGTVPTTPQVIEYFQDRYRVAGCWCPLDSLQVSLLRVDCLIRAVRA